MRKICNLLRYYLIILTLSTVIFYTSVLADQPEGELYWMVDPDDLDVFSLYDIDATGKGAIGTINHYCLANPGTGVYIPYDIEFDGQVYETEITGWCMVKPNYIPKRRGNYYIAFLLCK